MKLLSEREAASNDPNMQQVSQQLNDTRKQMRNASEAMQQQDTGGALASGKRSQRDLEQVRDELAKATAGQFDEAMKQNSRSGTRTGKRAGTTRRPYEFDG